ncbi:MAG: hypothetical protein RR547_02995 [Raoultibacter sp.]
MFGIAFALFCTAWAIMFAALCILAFFPGFISDSPSIGLMPIVMCIVFGSLVAILLRSAWQVFRDVPKGGSPFSRTQVRRIRRIAYVLLAYAVAEMIFSAGTALLVSGGDTVIGYSVTSGQDVPIISINVGMFAFSIIFYCLSLVFEYGTLLQRLSDETL